MISAGELNKRVTLQSLGSTQDADGGIVQTFTDVATVSASIEDISGREYVAANAPQNAAQTMIKIRYRDGIVPSMRVLHGSVAYNVEAVLGQDKIELLLMCKRAD